METKIIEEKIRSQLVGRIGNLTIANAELAGINEALLESLNATKKELESAKAKLEELSPKAADASPAESNVVELPQPGKAS